MFKFLKHVFAAIERYKTQSARWFAERAHGAHARGWLLALSFSESSFFVVPPDILLVAILMAGAERWIYYSTITIVASVVGGIFGYFVGFFFFDTAGAAVINFYGLSEEMTKAGELYDQNAFWVVFTGAFTPLPYKLFVLAGGFFKVNFLEFLLGSIAGRGLRYYAIGYVTSVFGGHMVRVLFRYFNVVTAIAVAVIVLWLFW